MLTTATCEDDVGVNYVHGCDNGVLQSRKSSIARRLLKHTVMSPMSLDDIWQEEYRINPDMAGELVKEGKKRLRLPTQSSWQKRFLLLKGSLLFYFKRADEMPIGVMKLDGMQYLKMPSDITVEQHVSNQLVLKIQAPEAYNFESLKTFENRIYQFMASSLSEMQIWVTAINASIDEARKSKAVVTEESLHNETVIVTTVAEENRDIAFNCALSDCKTQFNVTDDIEESTMTCSSSLPSSVGMLPSITQCVESGGSLAALCLSPPLIPSTMNQDYSNYADNQLILGRVTFLRVPERPLESLFSTERDIVVKSLALLETQIVALTHQLPNVVLDATTVVATVTEAVTSSRNVLTGAMALVSKMSELKTLQNYVLGRANVLEASLTPLVHAAKAFVHASQTMVSKSAHDVAAVGVRVRKAVESLRNAVVDVDTIFTSAYFFCNVLVQLRLEEEGMQKNGIDPNTMYVCVAWTLAEYTLDAALGVLDATLKDLKEKYVETTEPIVAIAGLLLKQLTDTAVQAQFQQLEETALPVLIRPRLQESVQLVAHYAKIAMGVWPPAYAAEDLLNAALTTSHRILLMIGALQDSPLWGVLNLTLSGIVPPTCRHRARKSASLCSQSRKNYLTEQLVNDLPSTFALVDVIRKVTYEDKLNNVVMQSVQQLLASFIKEYQLISDLCEARFTSQPSSVESNDGKTGSPNDNDDNDDNDAYDSNYSPLRSSMSMVVSATQIIEDIEAMELNYIKPDERLQWDEAKKVVADATATFAQSVKIAGGTWPPPGAFDIVVADADLLQSGIKRLLTLSGSFMEKMHILLDQHKEDQAVVDRQRQLQAANIRQLEAIYHSHIVVAEEEAAAVAAATAAKIEAEIMAAAKASDAIANAIEVAAPVNISTEAVPDTCTDPSPAENKLTDPLVVKASFSNINSTSTDDLIFFTSSEVSSVGVSMEEAIVKGGTLERLVERLTLETHPDPKFTTAFLLTYHSITTSKVLANMLIDRYNIEPSPSLSASLLDTFQTQKLLPIRLRVFNVFKMWLNMSPDDFRCDDGDLANLLMVFLDVMENDLPTAANALRKLISRLRSSPPKDGKKNIVFNKNAKPIIPPRCLPDGTLTILGMDPLEIARQLTLIDWNYYSAIQPQECLDLSWTKKDNRTCSLHILGLIDRSTRISKFVTTTIMTETILKARSNVLKHWIMVADRSRSINNFNTMMAIIAGCTNAAVYRMKKTWELLPSKTQSIWSNMRTLVSEDNNFARYREELHSINPPCIPFLGRYLTDLVFIEQGNKNILKGTQLINFEKRRKIARVIQEIQMYQKQHYNLNEVPCMVNILGELPCEYDENSLYKQSLLLEPRDSSTISGRSFRGTASRVTLRRER